ncbi:MAG: 23S rRNA (uracil(1939)-C(5))-methyltransferase RlmD, partial [Ferruginibacter sp.]
MAKRKKISLYNIEVTDYAAEGKSIARQDGKVIFIENAVPGDVVDVFLKKNKKDWAEAYVTRIHQYSALRIAPFCKHFGICGGCQWQMLTYRQQLIYKQQQVGQQLKRIGKIELPEILPIAGVDNDRHYRNKMEYTFGNKRFIPREELDAMEGKEIPADHTGVAGFHAKGVFDKLVDIEECHLQSEPTNAIRLWIKEFARANDFSFYDIKAHTGFLRNIQLRICTTGEVMLNIILGEDDEEKRIALLENLAKQFPQITTILYTINTKWNDSIYDLQPQIYSGNGYVTEKLEDFEFRISPKSFFQTNSKQAERLYSITRDFANLTGNEIVYDLYCGTGSIGIFVSPLAKKVIGVEVIEDAVADAKENAALNKIQNADFFAGDVIKICDDAFFREHGKPDVIITDPPRIGMHEKLVIKLLEIAAPAIVYVSCNVATQARDIGLLSEKYSVEKIQPVDMFPHTHHIECVV